MKGTIDRTMTEKLFDTDPYLCEFTARVTGRTERGVILDRTAFYPEGGGQPSDAGTLNGIEVTEVVEEGGGIVHVVSAPVEGEVRGVVDAERRRDHLQQHHGQHLLSGAFVRVAGAATTSFHLGRQECSIDLDREPSPDDIARAAELANRVVCENRPVTTAWVTPEEARALPLRKPPPETPRIRVVTVKDFDCQPCCGTHPHATGEAGAILVLGSERIRGATRVRFVCGLRAVAEAGENVRVLRAVGARLSAGRADLEGAVERVQADFAAARKQLAAAERRLATYLGRELAERGKIVVEVFEGKGIDTLRGVATQVVTQPGKVALLGGSGETSCLVLARSADVELDLRPILKEALALISGKGGGPPHFVQGGGSGKDVQAALRVAEERVTSSLGL